MLLELHETVEVKPKCKNVAIDKGELSGILEPKLGQFQPSQKSHAAGRGHLPTLLKKKGKLILDYTKKMF